jgi:DinB superfamily
MELQYNGGVKRLLSISLLFAASIGGLASAQTASSVGSEIKQAYTRVKENILKSAQKVPDDAFSFKPTPDLRSFAAVIDHVSDSQMRTCSAVLGEQKTADAASKTSKADVVAALEASFAECDKAYESLNDSNLSDTFKSPRGQRTKVGALAGNLAHDNEQYGILSVYMRLKNIVPPSSEH